MASAVTTVDLFANAAMITFDHNPGNTAAQITSPDGGTTKRFVEMGNYEAFAGLVMATIATGGPTLVDIVGADDATGTNITTIVTSGTVAADARGDFVAVECSGAQFREVSDAGGFDFTHIGVRITCANSADEAAVTYIRHRPRFPQADLTANAIA